MAETMILPPEIETTEIQLLAEYELAAEELSFPKLDGILFPVVVENAEVVAPCSWMGGAEVTLTVALNNYYRPMTEEDADEVIMDVYEFLANKINNDDTLEPECIEAQAPEDQSVHNEEEADELVVDMPARQPEIEKTVEEVVQEKPRTQHKEVEAPQMPRVVHADDPSQKKTEPKYENARTVKREPTNETQKSALNMSVDTEDVPSAPHPVEIRADVVVVDDSEGDVTVKQEVIDVPVTMNEPGQAEDGDIPVLFDEVDEPIELTVEVEAHDVRMEDEEKEADLAPFDQTEEDDGEQNRITNEQETYETTESEPPFQTDHAVERVTELLVELAQEKNGDERDKYETSSALADIITEMALSLEVEDDGEATMSEMDIQQELQDLYAGLLEHAATGTKGDELAALLAGITLELRIEDEESDVKRHRGFAQRRVKALSVVVSAVKQALTRIIAMGRSALRPYVGNFADGYARAA